jgi:hypothetical protein
MNQGKSGGSSRWKKWDVPWARPMSPMVRTSSRTDRVGAAAGGKVEVIDFMAGL